MPSEINDRSTASQMFTTAIANLAGIASGIAYGFSAILIPSPISKDNSVSLNNDQISWIASVIYITNMVGCGVGGIISDVWGRKFCIQIGNGICLLGWILIVTAYYCLPPYQFIVLLIGRLITGISIGIANVTTVVYTTETSSIKLRPMFTTWCTLSSTFGIFLIYLLGYCCKNNWAVISIFAAMVPLISFVSVAIFLPESPAWLDSQNNRARAVKSIKVNKTKKFLSSDTGELTLLLKNEENFERISLSKRLLQRTCVIPMSIIISYFFFLNSCGIFVIIAYASDFVLLLKIPVDSYLTICSFAVVRLIGSIFISIFSENLGRRCASIASGILATLSLVGIAIYLLSISTIPDEKLNILFLIPIVLMWIYIFGCIIGFATIPFAMVGEIFPLNIRGVASGISVCCNSFFTFMVIKIFPSSLKLFGIYELLLLYSLTSLIATILIFAFLPETKGKTLQEIENYFAQCNSLRKFKVLK